MKRTFLTSLLMLGLLIGTLTWPGAKTPVPTALCQESRACTSCRTTCETWGDQQMNACVVGGNDWYFCAEARTRFVRSCGEQRCPDCGWVQTY